MFRKKQQRLPFNTSNKSSLKRNNDDRMVLTLPSSSSTNLRRTRRKTTHANYDESSDIDIDENLLASSLLASTTAAAKESTFIDLCSSSEDEDDVSQKNESSSSSTSPSPHSLIRKSSSNDDETSSTKNLLSTATSTSSSSSSLSSSTTVLNDISNTSSSSSSRTNKQQKQSPTKKQKKYKKAITFAERLKLLEAFKASNGGTLENLTTKDEVLGNWVSEIRRKYKNDNLDEQKKNQLEAMGFLFEKKKQYKKRITFAERLKLLEAFKASNGGTLENLTTKDEVLGNWVSEIRSKYKNDNLDEEKKNQLKAIGFIFEKKKELKKDELPTDYDEKLILTNPTFLKWKNIPTDQTLEYSKERYTKGNELDDIRLRKAIFFKMRHNIDNPRKKDACVKEGCESEGLRKGCYCKAHTRQIRDSGGPENCSWVNAEAYTLSVESYEKKNLRIENFDETVDKNKLQIQQSTLAVIQKLKESDDPENLEALYTIPEVMGLFDTDGYPRKDTCGIKLEMYGLATGVVVEFIHNAHKLKCAFNGKILSEECREKYPSLLKQDLDPSQPPKDNLYFAINARVEDPGPNEQKNHTVTSLGELSMTDGNLHSSLEDNIAKPVRHVHKNNVLNVEGGRVLSEVWDEVEQRVPDNSRIKNDLTQNLKLDENNIRHVKIDRIQSSSRASSDQNEFVFFLESLGFPHSKDKTGLNVNFEFIYRLYEEIPVPPEMLSDDPPYPLTKEVTPLMINLAKFLCGWCMGDGSAFADVVRWIFPKRPENRQDRGQSMDHFVNKFLEVWEIPTGKERISEDANCDKIYYYSIYRKELIHKIYLIWLKYCNYKIMPHHKLRNMKQVAGVLENDNIVYDDEYYYDDSEKYDFVDNDFDDE